MCLHGGLVLADRPCPLICQSAVSNLPQDPGTENPQQCGGVSERKAGENWSVADPHFFPSLPSDLRNKGGPRRSISH